MAIDARLLPALSKTGRAFASPQSPGRTVLIVDVNPFMTGADFHPDAVYRLNT